MKARILILTTTFFCVSFLCLMGLITLCNKFIYYNDKISEPIGYYLVFDTKNVVVNSLYVITISTQYMDKLTKLGYHANSGTLLKQIVAKSGDVIDITKSGVMINNKLLANSKPVEYADSVGLQVMPVGYHKLLQDGEFWVMGASPHSVDSRYFGVINQDQILKFAYFLF